MQQTYIRDTDLADRYSVSRTTIWRWARDGVLPKPLKISSACTRWRLEDIERRDAGLDAGVA